MNIAPLLVCAHCHAAKLHIFIGRRPRRRSRGEWAYVDCLYACDACDTVRTWGNERREETAYGQRLADAALAHAVDVHGMRRKRCAACRGLGLDCSECDGAGQIWVFAKPERCGPDCLVEEFEPAVGE